MTGCNQHGFAKHASCLTKLIAFYDKVAGFFCKQRACSLPQSKTWEFVSHNIFESKDIIIWMGGQVDRQNKWLDGWSQRAMVNRSYAAWMPVTTGVSWRLWRLILGPVLFHIWAVQPREEVAFVVFNLLGAFQYPWGSFRKDKSRSIYYKRQWAQTEIREDLSNLICSHSCLWAGA